MRRKIAILGGGAASLIAAWELAKSGAGHDITVYQVGWRLGGKGASGRREGDERIEEHGLHLMFGFYQNVFRVVREVYFEAYGDRDRWQRFFKAKDTSVAMINYTDPARTRWEPWLVPYPVDDAGGLPGDADVDADVSVLRILRNLWNWLRALARDAHSGGLHDFDELIGDPPDPAMTLDQLRAYIDTLGPLHPNTFATLDARLDPLQPNLGRNILRDLFPDYWTTAKQFLGKLEDAAIDAIDALDPKRFENLLDRALDLASLAMGRAAKATRGMGSMLVFVKAVALGIFIDMFAQKSHNWFALDEWDLRDWIERHGGDRNAPQVDGLYDAVFAFYGRLGAGSILQAAMKAAFLFRGAAVWKMQAGMGDTIFTPLYLALKANGVKFAFFHRVEQITTNSDASAVESIVFDRQVDPAALPGGGYDPLRTVRVDLGGALELGCWPSEPLWDQIAEPEHGRVKAGPNLENHWTAPADPARAYAIHRVDGVAGDNEFNDVILGISVAALPSLCGDLIARDPAFANHVKLLSKATTATQALQVWTVPGKHPKNPAPIVVPNGTPYDTIADMSHLLHAERQPPGQVEGIYYLCSALAERSSPPPREDLGYPEALHGLGRRKAQEWLATRAPVLWPSLSTPTGFDWSALYDPRNGSGADRFAAQYVNTPINPSDRYVLSVPMTYRHRLRSNQTQYSNLYLTGDWIQTALSIGCLEATAMSGIQAARALNLESASPEIQRAHGDWIDDVAVRAARVAPALAGLRATRAPRPAYVMRDSELVVSPPYELQGDAYLFVLPAAGDMLRSICDHELNLDPAVRYTPVGKFVVLYAATLTNSCLGTTCVSTEAGIWLPVESAADSGLRAYSPYVWIDSATSALGGRLVFGYAKQVADVLLPKEGERSTITVAADAMTPLTERGSWRIERSPLFTATPGAPLGAIGRAMGYVDLARVIAQSIGLSPPRIYEMFNGMRSVFLKQTPDVDGRTAAYQAIVEATIVPARETLRGSVLTAPWNFEFQSYDTPNIARTLGLCGQPIGDPETGRNLHVQSIAQARVSFQARVDAGTVVWLAS